MIATINNHVLFWQTVQWKELVPWKGSWQSAISDAVTKHESRWALRAVARQTLSFTVKPLTLNEQSQFDDGIMQAKKFGLACAPFWGRGCRLTAPFTGATLQCGRGWDWTAGDYIYFQNETGYEVTTVATADYAAEVWTLELADVLTGTYRDFARPMIFGKFSVSEQTARSGAHAPARITISELTNARSVQIGETPPSSTGNGEIFITM